MSESLDLDKIGEPFSLDEAETHIHNCPETETMQKCDGKCDNCCLTCPVFIKDCCTGAASKLRCLINRLRFRLKL